MASQVTNYQCPTCTGPLHYAGDSGRLECEYCGSSFTLREIENKYKDLEEAAAVAAGNDAGDEVLGEETDAQGEWSDSGEYWDLEAEGLKVYNCPSCAAELVLDETTAATSCPYCGNPSIIPGVFSKSLRPDFIIPFTVTKDGAKRALRDYYKGKKLLPKNFSEENHIQELKGVYVPFWLFDGQVDADLQFLCTKVHTRISGDYEITDTDHFRVRRAATTNFQKIPVDASKKMPDDYMDAIGPFDFSELTEYSSAYLPGYMADKYDVSVEDCSARADERAINTAILNVQNAVTGYSTCAISGKRVNVHRGRVHYALLPVYMLSTQWRGQNYLFAMNGQNGKFIGDLPVDKGRFWAMFAKVALPVAAVLGFLLW